MGLCRIGRLGSAGTIALFVFAIFEGSSFGWDRAALTASKKRSEKANSATKPEKSPEYPKGTSSTAAKKQAIKQIPWDRMTAESKKKAEAVVEDLSYFRQMPETQVLAAPEVYNYFIDHPDAAVSMWRAMDISKMTLSKESANVYLGDLGDGTKGRIEVLYRGPQEILIACDGVYKNPVLKRSISARSLIHLQADFLNGEDGKIHAKHRAALFVQFPSQTVETVARIVSPVTGPMIDRNFVEIGLFIKMMTLAMERRPSWVEEHVDKMVGVDPKRKTELLNLTMKLHAEALEEPSLERISNQSNREPRN